MLWIAACGAQGGAARVDEGVSPRSGSDETPLCASTRAALASEVPLRTTRYTLAVKQQWTVSPVSFVMVYLGGEGAAPSGERADAGMASGGAVDRPPVDAALAGFLAKVTSDPAGVPLWEELNRQAVAAVLAGVPGLRAVASFVEVGGSAFIPTYRASAVFWQAREASEPEVAEPTTSQTLAGGEHCEAFFFRVTRLQFPGDGERVFDVPISYAFRSGERRYPDYLSVFDFAVGFLMEAVAQDPEGPRSGLAEALARAIERHPVFAKEMAHVKAALLLHDNADRARYAKAQPFARGAPEPFVQLEGAQLPAGAPRETALGLP